MKMFMTLKNKYLVLPHFLNNLPTCICQCGQYHLYQLMFTLFSQFQVAHLPIKFSIHFVTHHLANLSLSHSAHTIQANHTNACNLGGIWSVSKMVSYNLWKSHHN